MAMTLAQLRTVVTESTIVQSILDNLESLGFSSNAWQSGQPNRVMVEAFARDDAKRAEAIKVIADMAFNDTSVGDALTEFADSHYDNQRQAAIKTQGTNRLTAAAGAGPFTISAGELVSEDINNGFTYRNITGGTLAAGPSTLDLTFEAETGGADRNVANNTITILQTPLAGVTITNPDLGAGTWITKQGADAETDGSLQTRNRTKWATRSFSDPDNRYANLILTAVPGVARIEIDSSNPDGPGTLRIYIAGPSGVSGASDVTDAQTEADRIRNPTAKATAIASVAQPQDFTYTAHILTANNTAATQAAIEQALTDYVNGLPIGGTVLPPSSGGVFVLSEAIAVMTAFAGVESVQFTVPTGNVPITAHQVMTVGTIAPTYTSV